MNTHYLSSIVLAGLLLDWGCNHTPHSTSGDGHANHEEHSADSESLRLDQGEKWRVNDEMKPFIAESEAILEAFIASGSTDYKTLAGQLEEKNAGLIKSCTMDGESHEELHKWLHPHMDLVARLAQESDAQEAQSLVQSLGKSFDTYHSYFQ